MARRYNPRLQANPGVSVPASSERRGRHSFVNPFHQLHRALVLISGACEVLGSFGVLWTRARRAAGWGLIVLLMAVFAANVEAARNYGLPLRFDWRRSSSGCGCPSRPY